MINNLRLRSSIGIVDRDNIIDFFLANTRDIFSLKMNFSDIIGLLKLFDGRTSLPNIAKKYTNIEISQLEELALFLKEKYVLIEQDFLYPEDVVKKHYRLLNILEEYFHSTSEVMNALCKLQNSNVMIVGLGAVGSYIASYLAKSQVGNLILVDNDNVDISNLHRQYYFESQINKKKTNALKEELEEMNSQLNITLVDRFLTENFFEDIPIYPNIDLIINCSDEPNVDTTSRIVAKYAMQHRIPHIIGGGYNLHLTLIGQSIIPYKTACFECFNIFLRGFNDLKYVKKLHREMRKLGSFPPLSGISASLASLDAFKILIGRDDILNQANKRIEFNMRNMKFSLMEVVRNKECPWCSNNE